MAGYRRGQVQGRAAERAVDHHADGSGLLGLEGFRLESLRESGDDQREPIWARPNPAEVDIGRWTVSREALDGSCWLWMPSPGALRFPIPRSPAAPGRRRVPAAERCADARWVLVVPERGAAIYRVYVESGLQTVGRAPHPAFWGSRGRRCRARKRQWSQ
jgi:hypothetical protein